MIAEVQETADRDLTGGGWGEKSSGGIESVHLLPKCWGREGKGRIEVKAQTVELESDGDQVWEEEQTLGSRNTQ